MNSDRRDPHAELLARLREGPVSWSETAMDPNRVAVALDLFEAKLATITSTSGGTNIVLVDEEGAE